MLDIVVLEQEIAGPLDVDNVAMDMFKLATGDLHGGSVIGIKLHQAVLSGIAEEMTTGPSDDDDVVEAVEE